MLAKNTSNRAVHRRHLDRISAALKEGRWQFNGESIKIAYDGTLVDGQHRLMACVRTGIPFETIVVRNVSPDSYVTIDIGTKRTAADLLSKCGVANAPCTAGAVRWITALNTKQALGNVILDPDQVMTIAAECSGIEKSAALLKAFKLCPPAMACALHYLFSKKDSAEADRFFLELRDGEGLIAGDPVTTLRNRLFEAKIASKKMKQSPDEVCTLIIRAWNSRRTGKRSTHLKGLVRNDAGKYEIPDII